MSIDRLAQTAVLASMLLLIANADAVDKLPTVPDGFVVDVVAKEPMLSNPCVLAFDRLGRICVAQGPQWRAPTPETPGDRVDILIDEDGDGTAESCQTFAEGFNSIQGIAWHGDDLWVANAPDLTIVRDTDGDDIADKYIRVYTGLGNLEHCLHGLNFGPDGKLYMSKGNSKGYNRLDQLAPKAFRELWGLDSPSGAPDYTPAEVFTKENYLRNYHTPADDWGQQGGILRCDPYSKDGKFGRNLEIVSRGFRNPWDITFDDQFNWLGTDNDQTQGDRIFAPFHGANFGWGHPWSFHWTGNNHLPTVPNSANLFEGSGTGVIHYHADHFPPEYQNVFVINDWMRREIYAFQPVWDGALLRSKEAFPETFAHAGGGRTLPEGSGCVFEPTDIEVGPDGSLYVLSWGHGYGATLKDGKQMDAGRLYRIRFPERPMTKWRSAKRARPINEWTLDELFAEFRTSIPSWRVNAQNEFLRRGSSVSEYLKQRLANDDLTDSERTWGVWTLGRLAPDPAIDEFLTANLQSDDNDLVIQSLRVIAHRVKHFPEVTRLPEEVSALLKHEEARIRHAAVQAVWQSGSKHLLKHLLELASGEEDRIVFYSCWKAIQGLATLEQRKVLLDDERAGVRLAVLLGWLESDVDADLVMKLRGDPDGRVAAIANDWLEKTGAAAPLVEFTPPAGEYAGPVDVQLKSSVKDAFLTYSLDGSQPTHTSLRVKGSIRIDHNAVLRVAINRGNSGESLRSSAEYQIRHLPPFRHQPFVTDVSTPSERQYDLDWIGLRVGKRHYTDRDYTIQDVPPELDGMPFLRTANNDDRSAGEAWLSFQLKEPAEVIVGVDIRNNAPLDWMHTGGENGFEDTGLLLRTTDPTFRLFKKRFEPGKVVLGGNTNNSQTDSPRGNYVVIFARELLSPEQRKSEATVEEVLRALPHANASLGRELFLNPRGAGCFRCHQMEGFGQVLAPDLSDIGTRSKSPRVLVESILQPSRVITEGFAQQKILTLDGRTYTGTVVSETGKSLALANSDGKVTKIAKADIEERQSTKLSPMPPGFGKMLSAQQVADITAWLMSQTVVGNREGFSFRDQEDQLDVYLGKQRIATYLKCHEKLTRPALVNVNTSSGIQVTRNFPARAPEDIDPGYQSENGIIHPMMHPGIWISFGDLDSQDYWRLKAKVKFVGFVEAPKGDLANGSFAVKCLLMSEDGERIVCEEVTHYHFLRIEEGWLLTIQAEYKSPDASFYFGDQEESGLGVRVASPLRVQGGSGFIINDRGEKNGAEIWGKQAKWFDYSGMVAGKEVGILVASSPANVRPSWLHARDYGVVVTNPFPKQPRERREPYVKTEVKQNEIFKLGFALLIHERKPELSLNRGKAYAKMIDALRDSRASHQEP